MSQNTIFNKDFFTLENDWAKDEKVVLNEKGSYEHYN